MNMEQQSPSHKFNFTGTASEWFGIWIVNLLLSIVTLGIYSAWAKVRTKKYFYGNTYVDGRNFDYHATGGQILVGRLIVIAAFVVFQIIITIFPILGLILMLAFIFMFPWLIIRSLAFNAGMSSFSNVRFSFAGTYGRALLIYLIYPVLSFLTLYTTFPILDRATKRFSIENHRLGTASFYMEAPLSVFYKAAGIALVWIVGVFIAAWVSLGGGMFLTSQSFLTIGEDPEAIFIIMLTFYAVLFIGFIPATIIYQALTRNAIYSGTTLVGGHRLGSDVNPAQMIWIAVSNLVVVVCSLGLMLPWAKIRMARYLADHTAIKLGSSLDDFIGTAQGKNTALGDAYSDIEGIDVGIPI